MPASAAKRKGQALLEITKNEGAAIVERRLVVTVVLGWREYVLIFLLLLVMLLICFRVVL